MKIMLVLGVVVVVVVAAALILIRVILSIVQSVIAKGGTEVTETLRALQQAVDAVSIEADRQKRRGDEYLNIIYGIEGERDLWQKLYREQARSAGVAQAWLLRSLSDVTQLANARAEQLRSLGRAVPDVKIDPKLTELVQEFVGHHPDGAAAQVVRAPGLEKAMELEKAFQAEGSELPAAQKGAAG